MLYRIRERPIRVLIVGSLRHLRDDRRIEAEKACRQIGKALIEAGYTLTVGSDSRNTADYYVLQGAGDAGNTASVHVVRPIRSGMIEADKFREFLASTKYEFTFDKLKGRWLNVRGKQVNISDVVLLIGGSKGTRETATVAFALNRALIPVPCFGGAASDIYNDIDFQSFIKPEERAYIERWDQENSPRIIVNIIINIGGNPLNPPKHPPRPPSYQPPIDGILPPWIRGWLIALSTRAKWLTSIVIFVAGVIAGKLIEDFLYTPSKGLLSDNIFPTVRDFLKLKLWEFFRSI